SAYFLFFFSSRRRHTRSKRDWSSDVCSSDLNVISKTSQIGAMIGIGNEPTIRDKDAVARRMGELAKCGWKDMVTENELLKLHNPRNDGEFKSLVDSLVADGATIVSELRDRINVTKLQAISTGKVEYDDNNVKVNIDFTEDMPA